MWYKWIAETNEWAKLDSTIYTYNANGNVLEYEQYGWVSRINDWVGDHRYVIAYDANGNTLLPAARQKLQHSRKRGSSLNAQPIYNALQFRPFIVKTTLPQVATHLVLRCQQLVQCYSIPEGNSDHCVIGYDRVHQRRWRRHRRYWNGCNYPGGCFNRLDCPSPIGR